MTPLGSWVLSVVFWTRTPNMGTKQRPRENRLTAVPLQNSMVMWVCLFVGVGSFFRGGIEGTPQGKPPLGGNEVTSILVTCFCPPKN